MMIATEMIRGMTSAGCMLMECRGKELIENRDEFGLNHQSAFEEVTSERAESPRVRGKS